MKNDQVLEALCLPKDTKEFKISYQIALDSRDLLFLFQPQSYPYAWESCAQIIAQHADDELIPYVKQMLEWIEDLNWMGAEIIFERLKAMEPHKLKKPYLRALQAALTDDNEEWLSYLSGLYPTMQNVLDNDKFYEIAKLYYHRFWK